MTALGGPFLGGEAPHVPVGGSAGFRLQQCPHSVHIARLGCQVQRNLAIVVLQKCCSSPAALQED